MSFPSYPAYKDSGVDFLGKVPAHWNVSRLGFESWVRARLGWKGLKAEEYVSDGYAFLATPNIKGKLIDFENINCITQERFDESPEIQLREGDVLLAKDGSTLGTVNLVRSLPRASTVNSSIAVISPKSSLAPLFLYYFFQSDFMMQTIERAKGGMGVPHLFQDDLNKFYFALPLVEEQNNIAFFLEHETSAIERLVREQENLIELLKEKRKSLISHAVTKGLNPDALMKPSGIVWLGDVPKHWSTIALKRELEFLTSGSRGWAENYSEEGDLFIRIANLTRDSIELELADVQRVAIAETEEGVRTRVRPGDVLFSITAYLGSVAVVPMDLETAYVSQHVALARIRSAKLTPKWVAYVALSTVGKTWFELRSYGGTKIQLSLDDIRDMPIPTPPIPEQDAIVHFIDDAIARFDALIFEGRQAVELLHERRAALISAAVTGQIDVRGLVESNVV